MSDAFKKTFELRSLPGVKRDGTGYDGDYYSSAQWVRFQRGRPRKMGGYRDINSILSGPVRELNITSRGNVNYAHAFSQWGVQQVVFDRTGAGAGLIDRTPSGFTPNVNYTWQSDSMYDSTGGTTTALVCTATPDIDSIANDTAGPLYSGDISTGAALTTIDDGSGAITVSGGCVVLQPFLFIYGSNGLIRNSNANDFSVATGWTGTFANEGNFAGTKIVKGLPIRGGASAPAGLFWALDSMIRVSFIGGTAIWKYDPIGGNMSVMSKSAIVEYDGVYYWPGLDRFYMYTGVVQELPNDMNSNWFFDNVDFANQQRVWALKVPRFGEIWWFFPRAGDTECAQAIIYNVKEQTWYDAALIRTTGETVHTFKSPVMVGGEPQVTTLVSYTAGVGTFGTGQTITGGTSGATGVIRRILTGKLNLVSVVGVFVNGEGISNSGAVATGTINAVPVPQQLDTMWQHEYGYDRVKDQDTTAIEASFETGQFSLTLGTPAGGEPAGMDVQTRLTRVEPDFRLAGSLSMEVRGQSFPQGPIVTSSTTPITADTVKLDPRVQHRIMSLRFTSNEAGGTFETGKLVVTVEPGDERSS